MPQKCKEGCGRSTNEADGICIICRKFINMDKELSPTAKKNDKSILTLNRENEKEAYMGSKVCPECNLTAGSNRSDTCGNCGHVFAKKEKTADAIKEKYKGKHRQCSFEGCVKFAVKNKMCTRHFKELSNAKKPERIKPAKSQPVIKDNIVSKLEARKELLKAEIEHIDDVIETIRIYAA